MPFTIFSKVISENHIIKIISYVERNSLNSLEELLNISGIGPKVLRKVCDKILERKNGVETLEKTKGKKRKQYYIIPSIDENKKKVCVFVTKMNKSLQWECIFWFCLGIRKSCCYSYRSGKYNMDFS